MTKRRTSVTPGTILGIPREEGGYYPVIYITSNRFGDAFGLFDGFVQEPHIPSTWSPTPILRPVYSGTSLIEAGRWVRLGHRADLLKLFPNAPEIYHAKVHHPANPKIGPYGSAETPTEELRQLTETEANEIGLTNNSYRQVRLEEELEQFLNDTLG